jgi:ATP-dependent DNA helicase RecQ
MVRVCAAYIAGDMLFDVEGLVGKANPVPSYVRNTFAALSRGAPTRPSLHLLRLMMLEETKHQQVWENLSSEPLWLIGDKPPNWEGRIRGDDATGYNPALKFFDSILPQDISEIAYIQHLLVPEYPLFKQRSAPKNLFPEPNDECVDFYLPQADLVIEVDGSQHLQEPQKSKDTRRDSFLKKLGITTLRLKTSDLENRNTEFKKFCKKLTAHCNESPRLQPYRAASEARKHSEPSLRHDITAVIRLQFAVMLAIRNRQLDLETPRWRLHVTQDFVSNVANYWAKTALDELLDWFGLFARLTRTEFQAPEVVFDEGGLHFDIRLFERPDNSETPTGVIRVRTCAVQDHPIVADSRSPSQISRVQDFGLSFIEASDAPDFLFNPPATSDLNELLFRVFGHQSFRPGQESLILNALSGQKSLGLMPTGGGKSLCFQLPALMKAGTTITIVPIKALGRDHCHELDAAGFTGRIVNIDSDTPKKIQEEVYAPLIKNGAMRFVFVSPERFQVEKFRNLVSDLHEQGQLRMFVIDEVHCMSEWGHDFRPSYLTLPGTLRNLANSVPVLGLTATASVNVLSDIQAEFGISDEFVAYEMHRSRTELNFSIRRALSSPPQIAAEVGKLVMETDGNLPPAIHIFTRYANGVMGVESYATAITNKGLGLRVGTFSGSTPDKFDLDIAYARLQAPDIPKPRTYEEYKRSVQELWKEGRLDVIITTKAFGMGVNKPDVRHTLHAGMPSSMEAFYQEAGRAGRDQQHADCHMLLRLEPDEATEIYEQLRRDLSPAAIEKAREYDNVQKKLPRNGGGDFRAQLYFLAQGLIDISAEADLVNRVLEILRSAPDSSVLIRAQDLADLGHGTKRLQETLYRLYQMGLIEPWTVTDWGYAGKENSHVQAVMVTVLPATFADACQTVANRIQAIDGKSADLSSVYRLLNQPGGAEDWQALTMLLLDWVRRKHLDSRLQSTWNLYSKSVAFTPDKAVAFREELEAFFKVDSGAFELAALRDMPMREVVPALERVITNSTENSVVDMDALRRLSAQLARLLEGTQESPGLNLAAAILFLLTDYSSTSDAEMRFDAAVTEGAVAFWCGYGNSLLTRVASANISARDVIGEWLIRDSPDRQTLLKIQETIPAKAIEGALFDDLAAELRQII